MNNTFKPMENFPHLQEVAKTGELWDHMHLITRSDFENGLNPFEPEFLKIVEQLDIKNFNLFTDYCTSSSFLNESKKDSTPPSEFISRMIARYVEVGAFEKKDTLDFLSQMCSVDQTIACDVVHRLIEQGNLALSDEIALSKTPWSRMKGVVMAPLLFSLDARYAHTFFEKYGTQKIKSLSFNVKKYHSIESLSKTPEGQTIVQTVDYLEFAEIRKEKKLLELCAEYLSDDKSKKENAQIDKLFSTHLTVKQKSDILKLEIKKINTQLPGRIDDPRLTALLGYEKKDALLQAIDSQYTLLVEKMIDMDFFQNRKSYIGANHQCYVGWAANKSSREIEKMLMNHHVYDVQNFGVPERQFITPYHSLSPKERSLIDLYYPNATNLSDNSMAQLIAEGFVPDAQHLVTKNLISAYRVYLEKYPKIETDPYLMAELHRQAQKLSNASRPVIFMILESIQVLNSSANTQACLLCGQALESDLMQGLAGVDTLSKASFIASTYLKYFPEKKEFLLEIMSHIDQDWARSFERKKIDETLKQFSLEMGSPKIEKSNIKKYKI